MSRMPKDPENPSRTPYASVRQELRREVGFHCPASVAGGFCGSPHLTWHHFDPPWRVEHHHRPQGMIALCREHADKADNGSYTDDQLRRWKAEGRGRHKSVSGRFDWMRRELLVVAGGSAFWGSSTILMWELEKALWFNRNEYGELLLNLSLPNDEGRVQPCLEENTWVIPSGEGLMDLVAPPSGRSVVVRYVNGGHFQVEYLDVADAQALGERFPHLVADPKWPHYVSRLPFPLTVVRIEDSIVGARVHFSKDLIAMLRRDGGWSMFQGSMFMNIPTAIYVGDAEPPGEAGMILQSDRSSSAFFRSPHE